MAEASLRPPTLIVVCGPPGCGKTTLAHEIARTIGCPVISRDEIKEGMVQHQPEFTPSPGDPLTQRTFRVFFDVLDLLLREGVTIVAEAAFRGGVWRPGLERLAEFADIRIVECAVDPAVARARQGQRDAASHIRQAAHAAMPARTPAFNPFEPILLGVPTLRVDTTQGYAPGIQDVVAFLSESRAGERAG